MTNSTAMNSSAPIDMTYRLSAVIQFDILGAAGIIVNLLPLLVTILGYVKHSAVNFMIANLAFCEFTLCVSFVFGQSFVVLWREWLPDGWCHFLSFVHFTMAFACFIFPPMLALNRYIHLYDGETVYKRWYSKKRVLGYISGCWIFCSLVPLIFILAGKSGFDEDNYHCCILVHDVPWIVAYWMLVIVPLLLVCNVITCYCNFRIYRKLTTHAKEATISTNVVRDHREMLYFLLADMCSPILFHSTYHLFKFLLIDRNEFWKRFFPSLYFVNSICRGTITMCALRPYRTGVRRMLRGQKPDVSVVHPMSGPEGGHVQHQHHPGS